MGKGNTKKKSTGSAYEDEFPVTLEGFGYKFDKGCWSLLLCDIIVNQIYTFLYFILIKVRYHTRASVTDQHLFINMQGIQRKAKIIVSGRFS